MSHAAIDPELPGIWIIPGEQTTYEIDQDGNYHIADPAQPLTVAADGAAMIWGRTRFDRIGGDSDAPIGAWALLDPNSWEKLVEYRRPQGEKPAARTKSGAAG
jgi:hypothetical protein